MLHSTINEAMKNHPRHHASLSMKNLTLKMKSITDESLLKTTSKDIYITAYTTLPSYPPLTGCTSLTSKRTILYFKVSL